MSVQDDISIEEVRIRCRRMFVVDGLPTLAEILKSPRSATARIQAIRLLADLGFGEEAGSDGAIEAFLLMAQKQPIPREMRHHERSLGPRAETEAS